MRKSYSVVTKALLSWLLLVSSVGFTWAQLALTRSYFTGTYTSIAGLPGTTRANIAGDDALAATLPIGFTFNYLGTNYTTFDVNTNGAMAFTGSALAGVTRDNGQLYLNAAPNGVISAWFDDMTVDTVGGNGVMYQTTGSPGSQVCTIEWRAINSYFTGTTQKLNFQVKLYEGTNVIEFLYGSVVTGTASASESASIGLENNTGGVGNYLDAVTGSSNCGNGYLQAATDWPARHFRFTPGAPSVLAGGTYTVGVAGTYGSISDAVAEINHRGISGPVVLSLIDATYDNTANGNNWFPILFGSVTGSSSTNTILMQPASGVATITGPGHTGGFAANGASATAMTTTSEPLIGVVGTDYLGLSNLNLTVSTGNLLDRGLQVVNNTATNGAQFNAFANLTIALARTNTSAIGIQQNVPTAPTSIAGANSSNNYMNLNIQNANGGIYLLGNATFPDLACSIGTLTNTVYNTIGGSTANDLGNGTGTQAYGIRCGSQSGVNVFNNNVQNVGSTTTTDGILMELTQGTSSVYNNNVMFIRGASTTATTNVCGIRANVATTAGHSLRVYNNGISNLLSAYTGAATATKQLKGIFIQSAGGGLTTSNINVDNNSVYIDASSSPNISSVCFEHGTSTGPVFNIRNNNFMNATGAQTAPAGHWGMRSTSATLVGNTGSVSNRNNVFVTNATQGFFGQGAATDYAALANWQAAMVGQDANSISVDPLYVNAAIGNLHAAAGGTNDVASSVAWVTLDIDNQTRSLTTPDIGYDEYTPTTIDVGAVTVALPNTGACYTAAEPIHIRVRNYGISTLNFGTNNMTITVNVTGAATATLNTTVAAGTLAPSSTADYLVGNLNMTTPGTYTFNATATVTSDQNLTNDAMLPVNRVFSTGTVTASPGNVCAGDSATLTLAGHNGSTIAWEYSTDNGATWQSSGSTVNPYRVAPTDTTLYRAQVCGLSVYSVLDTVNWIPTSAPTAIGDTICGVDTATIAVVGGGTTIWYDSLTGGNIIGTGTTLDVVPSQTTTYYVGQVNGAQSGTHLTTMAAGNGANGNVFAVRTLNSITITGFNTHCSSTAGTLTNWEVWYRPDDYLLTPGSQNSNVGWTQLAVYTGIPSAGPSVETVLPNNLSLSMPANSKWSFMVCATSGSVSYTNGTTTGNLYNANADLEVYQGHGGALFALPNNPRVFNGRIKYSKGCPTPRSAVVVVVNPADSISATASSSVSCSGDPVNLDVSSSNANYGYTWSPGATLNSTTGSSVIATPTASTTYTVVAYDSTTGCRNVATLPISYINKPVVTATVTPDTICPWDSVALATTVQALQFQIGTGTVTNTSTSYPSPFGNFYWGSRHQMLIRASELTGQGMNAGFINAMSFDVTNLNGTNPHENFEIRLANVTASTISAFLSPTFTTVYSNLSFTPALGISPLPFSTPFYWDGVSDLLVETCHNNAAFLANISVNQSSTTYSSTVYFRQDAAGVCANSTVTGTANQRPNMTFWMTATYGYEWTPGNYLVNPFAANTMGTAMSSTDFIMMVTDSVTGCVGVDTASLYVHPGPQFNLGNDGYFCGSDVTLDAGNDGVTYLWSTGDTTSTVFVNTNGTYSVDVTDSMGCTLSDTVAITFTPFPTVSVPDTAICQGGTASLDAGNPGSTYLWSNGDTTQVIVVTTSGTYDVQLIDPFGCPGADTATVVVNALPNVSFTSPVDTICNTNNAPVNLSGTPSGGAFSGTGVSGNQFSAPTAGVGNHVITYTFTDGNGCTNAATDNIFVEICASLADGLNAFNLTLYPNPNQGTFNFEVPMDVAADVRFEVSDARGTVILRGSSNQPSGNYVQPVDVRAYSAGVYTLRVSIDGKTATKRFVVQR